MDANRCVHVGLSLYLLTFIGDLRYKMLLIQTSAMHSEINSPDISQVYPCVFRAAKNAMRTFYKHTSLKLMLKFINLR